MFKETYQGMKRIQRRAAKRAFEAGKDVFLTPHKMRFDNHWNPPSSIKQLRGKYSFDDIVNDFEYYQCNRETGKYASFYVLD